MIFEPKVIKGIVNEHVTKCFKLRNLFCEHANGESVHLFQLKK